jgi:ADP-heptose:LPS heptosyltransferase
LGQERCTDSLKLNLKQDSYLISQAKLLITCDTGPMHIGFATSTQTIALFGLYNPEKAGPYDLEEKKCFSVLPSEDSTLQDITVEEVWQTVQTALEK